ncbi:MAG TPA: nucleotide exchange factor GrpE [Defluviitaleaceae bacterium]|nr:nucleotide exchange factor GrpE [Candidatus Epulonipiscium sp.]HOA79997.1 nucleotide exchange factor GrpE [Defluviitaleaceae bacterium]
MEQKEKSKKDLNNLENEDLIKEDVNDLNEDSNEDTNNLDESLENDDTTVLDEETDSEIDLGVMKKNLQEKEAQCSELLDRLQRTMAEFDNYRKRTQKEKAVLFEDGVRSTIEQILPVIDNFERALSTADADENNPYLQGLEMIYRQFQDILLSIGVEEIKAVGEKFNPDFHNAVTHVEDEAYGENEIVEEFQKGYIYKEKVIRYSMVKVAN